VVLAMRLMEAKKFDAILDIRRLTEGGFVGGVSAGERKNAGTTRTDDRWIMSNPPFPALIIP